MGLNLLIGTKKFFHGFILGSQVSLRFKSFEGNMRERFFEGKLLLAETYCYN